MRQFLAFWKILTRLERVEAASLLQSQTKSTNQ